jgi:uncharacterized protein (TIGR03435 family)
MTEHALARLKSGVSLLFVAAGLMTLAVPCCLGQAGAAATPTSSSPASAEYVPTMTFDVASVRENKDVGMHGGFIMSGRFMPRTTTYRATNWPIENLISNAYGVMGYQIVDAPKWPYPTFFTIEAKGSSEADAKMAALTWKQQEAEQEHMMQGLLAERFKLKAHWEMREGDVYNLVVAKGGPKLGAAGSLALSAEEKERYGDHPAPAIAQLGCNSEGCIFIGHGCTMGQLVGILPGEFPGQVFDKTGLTGKYDFVLKYMGGRVQDRPPDDMNPTPPMDRALQEELGLKVETAKGPVKVLVIDHVEKPSEN